MSSCGPSSSLSTPAPGTERGASWNAPRCYHLRVDDLLRQGAVALPDPQSRQVVEEAALLRRCREVGIEQAFAETMGAQLAVSRAPQPGSILEELDQPAGRTDMIGGPVMSAGVDTPWRERKIETMGSSASGVGQQPGTKSIGRPGGEPGADHRRLPAGAGGDDPPPCPSSGRRFMMNLANAYSHAYSGRPGGEPGTGHRRLPAGAGGDDPPGHAGRVGDCMMNLATAY